MRRLTRAAFLYMDPRLGMGRKFSQCSTCIMWIPDNELCSIHGTEVDVGSGDTCGLYVPGKPHGGTAKAMVTSQESGLEHRQVRCENCRHFSPEDSTCNLYIHLNDLMPSVWDLDEKVHAMGCCNANQE